MLGQQIEKFKPFLYMVHIFNEGLDRRIIFNKVVIRKESSTNYTMWLENSVCAMACESFQPLNTTRLLISYCEVLFLAFFAFQSMKGFYEDLAVTALGSNLVSGNIKYRVG